MSSAEVTCCETPHECALAVGIPLSYAEFDQAWQRRDREFPRKLIGAALGICDPADAWVEYSSYCRAVVELLNAAAKCGVSIVEKAALDDLPRLMRRFRVVTILAHSPFPLLHSKDVRCTERLRALFQLPATTSEKIPEAVPWLLKHPEIMAAQTADELLAVMNVILKASRIALYDIRPAGTGPGDHERSELRSTLTPVDLYLGLARVFRSPRILELRDGGVDFSSFARRIPKDFNGTLDFIACSSLWFAPSLRRVRPNVANYLCQKQLVFTEEWMRIYLATVRYLNLAAVSFAEARFKVHYDLLKRTSGPPTVEHS